MIIDQGNPEYLIRINMQTVDTADACISVLDHGFLFGDSIYEVVRTINGSLFAWDEHLRRLRNSAERLGYKLPWSDMELTLEIEKVVEVAPWEEESYIRIIVTRGVGRLELSPETCDSPTLIVIAKKLPIVPDELYEKGIVLCLTEIRRNSRLAMDPAIKSGNYLNNVLAMIEAREKGADDAVMLNENGFLTESTTSNFFIVKDGVLKTPSLDCGILAGITREYLLDAVRRKGIPVEETELTVDDLRHADEVFITGTIKAIVPVRKVIGEVKWEGKPDEVTSRIREAYFEATGML